MERYRTRDWRFWKFRLKLSLAKTQRFIALQFRLKHHIILAWHQQSFGFAAYRVKTKPGYFRIYLGYLEIEMAV